LISVMSEAPKVSDLYGDLSPREAAARHEEYLGELTKSNSKPIDAGSMIQGSPMAAIAPQSPSAAIEAVLGNESMVKSMAPEALASLNSALESQRAIGQDIVKDLTLTSPISTGLVAFDLEAPAKLLTPRPTPLRNKIPRKKGVGTSHRIKVISGYTGTGTGGVGNTWPGITDSTTTTFGSINYLRGPKITYAGYDKAVNYKQFSLSDAVPFSAQFQGQGYQDIRQLSQTSTLYASMLMEERMLLMSRGTDSGFSGALAAPTFALTSPVAGSGQTALANTTYYVNVTADAGAFGESILGTEASTAVAAGDVLQIDITPVAGALGYNIYVGTATGAANLKYQGRSTGTRFVVQGAASIVTVGDTAPFTTTGAAATRATADTSAYATGYDGILPTVLGSESGFINRINSTFSTSNPGSEFQTVFSALYQNVKADPDEVLLNGADRKQLSDAIKSGSTANYRLNITQDEVGGVTLGNIVTGLQNEVTGKGVSLTVHPWLPQGVAPVLSYTLPIPDTNVSDVWAVFNTQDYMAIEWPVTQFAYETSTYWNGTFQCQAPAWNGVVSGIISA
jgi:hypothetical protein